MKNVFIDGYNVINSWPELKKIKQYSFQSARQRLIEILQNYVTYKGCKIFLIFDGHMVNGNIEKKEKIDKKLMVIFTREGETADSYIERAVNNIGRKIEVCVVTSDSLIQQLVFQRGAIRMSSLEFYHEVEQINDRIKVKIHKKYSERRCTLEERVKENILEKLEKIRRSK